MTGCAFLGGLLWGCRKEQLINQRMLKSTLISLTSGQAGNVPLGKRGWAQGALSLWGRWERAWGLVRCDSKDQEPGGARSGYK